MIKYFVHIGMEVEQKWQLLGKPKLPLTCLADLGFPFQASYKTVFKSLALKDLKLDAIMMIAALKRCHIATPIP